MEVSISGGRIRIAYCHRKRARDVKHGVAGVSVRWQSSSSSEIPFSLVSSTRKYYGLLMADGVEENNR